MEARAMGFANFNPVIRGDGAAPVPLAVTYGNEDTDFNPVIRGDGAAPL